MSKQVSGDIPYEFLNELGHNTRAMERFFDLPAAAQDTLLDAVSADDDPDARIEQAIRSLSRGGEGYFEAY